VSSEFVGRDNVERYVERGVLATSRQFFSINPIDFRRFSAGTGLRFLSISFLICPFDLR
jgi:hypothetical protein